jgi:indole-3-glycerol phosphate synthase
MLSASGAPAFSVVTEGVYFGGSLELLEEIVKGTGKPVLRKDFINEIEDLYRTKECGAAAVLLICSMHTEASLRRFHDEAVKIGLEPLLETHSREELLVAGRIGARLVGINNRNILELEKDSGTVSVTESLSAYTPRGALLISESGIRSYEDAAAALRAGADAALVGTAIWQAEDPAGFLSLTLLPR